MARNFGGRELEEQVRVRSGRSRGSASSEVRDSGAVHYVTSFHVISSNVVRVSVEGARPVLCAQASLRCEEFKYESGECPISLLCMQVSSDLCSWVFWRTKVL